MKKQKIALIMLCAASMVFAKETKTVTGFNEEEWHVKNPNTIVQQTNYKGKTAIFIDNSVDKEKGGIVYLKDFDFENGTIECDIASDIFTGLCFRVQSDSLAENVYFRSFNSGTSKHDKTVQYVARGTKYTWHYLRENFPGKYESGADIYKNEWFHVKIEVKGKIVRVHVNNAKEPVLVVNDLKLDEDRGSIGLWTWKGYFSNIIITKE